MLHTGVSFLNEQKAKNLDAGAYQRQSITFKLKGTTIILSTGNWTKSPRFLWDLEHNTDMCLYLYLLRAASHTDESDRRQL